MNKEKYDSPNNSEAEEIEKKLATSDPRDLYAIGRIKTPGHYAEMLLEDWSHGTDLRDQLSDQTWRDFMESARATIMIAQKESFKVGQESTR